MSFLFFFLSTWFTGHPAVDRHNRQSGVRTQRKKAQMKITDAKDELFSRIRLICVFFFCLFVSLFLYYTIVHVRVSPVTFLVSRVPCTKSRDSPISRKVSYKKILFFIPEIRLSLSFKCPFFVCRERVHVTRATAFKLCCFFCFLLKWQLTDGWK